MYLMTPLEEIKEMLAARFDEITLLEVMEVDSQMLVDRFSDLIEDDPDKYARLLDEISPYNHDEEKDKD